MVMLVLLLTAIQTVGSGVVVVDIGGVVGAGDANGDGIDGGGDDADGGGGGVGVGGDDGAGDGFRIAGEFV